MPTSTRSGPVDLYRGLASPRRNGSGPSATAGARRCGSRPTSRSTCRQVILTWAPSPRARDIMTYSRLIAPEFGLPMDDIISSTPYAGYAVRLWLLRQPDLGGRRPSWPRQGSRERVPQRGPPARGLTHIEVFGTSTTSRVRPTRRRPSRSRLRARPRVQSARRHGALPRRDRLPRHPELHVAVRDPHRPRGDRRGDRRVDLERYIAVATRQEDQPDDRRRAAPRRHRAGRRPGPLGGGRLRRDGQLLSGSMLDYALPRAAWLPLSSSTRRSRRRP